MCRGLGGCGWALVGVKEVMIGLETQEVFFAAVCVGGWVGGRAWVFWWVWVWVGVDGCEGEIERACTRCV